jgi:cytochrome P450
MDDPENARYRKLISRAFTPGMLQPQASRLRSSMDDAIDAIAGRRACDFVESLAVPLPMRMIAGMLGFDAAFPGAVLLKAGTLDDPSAFGTPQMVIFTIDKQSFHHLPEGVPAFERTPS